MKLYGLVLSLFFISQGYATVFDCPRIPGEIHVEGNTAYLINWGGYENYGGSYAVKRNGNDFAINYDNDWSIKLENATAFTGISQYSYSYGDVSRGYCKVIKQDERSYRVLINIIQDENRKLKNELGQLKAKVNQLDNNDEGR